MRVRRATTRPLATLIAASTLATLATTSPAFAIGYEDPTQAPPSDNGGLESVPDPDAPQPVPISLPVTDAPTGLTRAELAMTAARTLAALRGRTATVADAPFTDIAGHPWADDIDRAFADGLVFGHGDGTFRPDAPASDRHVELVNGRLLDVLVAEGRLAPPAGGGDEMPEPVIATFDTPDGSFRVLIDQPAAINRLAGAEVGTHVGIPNGRIMRGDGGVNTGRSWHLVEVEIVDMTIEVCDGTANAIDEKGYDAYVAEFGDRYCPWGAVFLGSEPVPAPAG